MRPGTNRGATAMGGQRGPGSRAGLGTAVGRPPPSARLASGLTSSMGRQAAVGVALQQGVNITDRPTTNQGMRGMKTSHGSTRLVQDSTYFVGIVRNKINDISDEMDRLRQEVDTHRLEQSQAAKRGVLAQELDKEVRALENTLADYNLALDKQRHGMDPAELHECIRELEAKNRAFANEVDRIFLQKQAEERAIAQIEHEKDAVYQRNQQTINAMEPGKQQQYGELLEQSRQLQESCTMQQSQADQIADHVAMLQEQRDANTLNQEYRVLQQRAIKLHKQLRSLQEEAEITRLDPAEMQQHMLAKVRADNNKAVELGNTIEQLQGEVMRADEKLQELKHGMNNREDGDEQEKYEKLFERDREMTEFIDGFDKAKEDIEQEQREVKGNIVALLEHISQGLDAEQQMPSQARLKTMQEQATLKQRQLDRSEQTMARLQQEHVKRKGELEKIKTLDEKIKIDLASLEVKMGKMREEMRAFDDLDGMRAKSAKTKEYLQAQLESYKKRTRTTREQCTGLQGAYEGLNKELEASETHSRLKSLEKKLGSYAQGIFNLQEFVETKGRATDYESIKSNCMGMCNQLNTLAKESMTTAATNLSDAPLSMPMQQW